MNEKAPRLRDLLGPRYWLLWLGLGLLRLAVLLPFKVQLAIGRGLGRIIYRLVPSRVAVTRRNIRHCFPQQSAAETEALIRRHFESLGISFFETAMCWWGTRAQIEPLGDIEGLEHLQQAKASGQGVILLTAHFTNLELGGLLLCYQARFAAVYRQMNNPLLEYFTAWSRNRNADEAIPKDNIKRMIKRLRNGENIWFAPDQQHQGNHSALVSFFGQPAHSATVTSSLAKLGRAKVVPFFVERHASRYRIRLLPALENFPSGDEVADTERYHRLIEAQIKRVPEQYLWVHKRFKDAPGFKYGKDR